MLSIRLLALPILFSASAALSAACTGTCTTIEYRKDEDYDATDVTYERDGSGYWVSTFTATYYVPATGTESESRGGGTPSPQETAVVTAMTAQANAAVQSARARINTLWQQKTSDAGTTNNCSTGCECAEGSFTDAPSSLWVGSSEIRSRTVIVNGKSTGYFAMWSAGATIEYTKRTKTVDCVALEP